MSKRRRRTGVLTSLAKYPESSKKPRKRGPLRKVLEWIGMGVVGAFFIAVAVLFLIGSFRIEQGKAEHEGDFVVRELVVNPPGYLPEDHVAAIGRIVVQDKKTHIEIPPDRMGEVHEGDTVHVKYVWYPRTRRAWIESWYVSQKQEP